MFQLSRRFDIRQVHKFHHVLNHVKKRPMSFYYNENEFRKQLLAITANSPGSVDLSKNVEDGIATVTINNPERENCLTGRMMADLSDIVGDLESWTEGKGVILNSAQGKFCSGGDLVLMNSILNPMDGAKMCLFMQNVTTRLLHLPLISVALVEGRALGGGAELATACDYRIMTPDARVGYIQVKLDITTGWGGGTRLVRLIGRQKALDLLSTGRSVDAEEALKIGLADKVLDEAESSPAEALSAGRDWLKQFTFASPNTVQAIKKTVSEAFAVKQETALDKEKEKFASVWGSKQHKEAMAKGLKHKN